MSNITDSRFYPKTSRAGFLFVPEPRHWCPLPGSTIASNGEVDPITGCPHGTVWRCECGQLWRAHNKRTWVVRKWSRAGLVTRIRVRSMEPRPSLDECLS